MKQIIVKIDKDLETGNQQMVINCTTEDDNTKCLNNNNSNGYFLVSNIYKKC